jgi:uncharacterized membrane protein (UPF0127 family)
MRNTLLLILAALAAAARADSPPVELAAGMHLIHAEVADSDATRMRGLMYRESLATNAGMVFVFEERALHCMWMKNTLVPLSVAFIDEAGAIINIADMLPKTEQSHCAAKPARYALEMNKGWFTQRGVKPGVKLKGLEKLAPR